MPLHHPVPDTTSDFEPSTLSALTEFDDDDADHEVDNEVDNETDDETDDVAESRLAADSVAVDEAAPQIDFAAAFGPVANRWEAMLRWYEMSTPALTH